MRRKDDILWKGILEDIFDDFLRFLSPDVESVLDLDKGFEFLDKELEQVFPPEDDKYTPKVIDKLVKVFTKSGKEEWILVHIEVQGQYHQDFAKRMFTYFYRILDKYQKPITAYAIFTEANSKERPDTFESTFMGTSIRYTFNTYKIANQSEQELLTSNNPFALVILTAKASMQGKNIKNGSQRDELLLTLKLKLAKQLLIKKIPKNKVRVLMNFLKYYVRFENPEINTKFEEQVEILTQRSNTMGIEELLLDRAEQKGLEKGKKEKSRHVVENLIIKLGLSDEQIADLAEVSVDFVKSIRAQITK
nr:hypothetical protein [uncultured Pedobacter sp.]